MAGKEILIIKNLADFEKKINRDSRPYDINMMVMPGTLEDKHKDVDPEKGIQALRRQFNLVYIILDGVHDVHLGADYRWLRPNDLVIVPENFLYASTNVSNCKGYCMHFKTEFIQSLLKGPLAEEFPFFDFEAEHIVNVTPEESLLIQQSFRDIIAEYERFSSERDYLLRNYIHILLLRVREIYRPHAKHIGESATRSMKITNQFKHLVEKNFIEHREVQYYAAQLHITPKYLSEVVKMNTGKSPRDIINDMLLLEAKVLLGSTNQTITEIAHQLQFQDQSHFSHFIKQQTGF
ncbi:MAG TPA: helix-turn-helix domain-containing protein, partial [Chitinophagaceae bacterium]|nr:helix-turn-helix domain-containing protein [Chitinophagaceae bacterium]